MRNMFKYLNPLYFLKMVICIFKNIKLRGVVNETLTNVVSDTIFRGVKFNFYKKSLIFGINLQPEIKLMRGTNFDLDIEERKQLALQITKFNDVFIRNGIIDLISIKTDKVDNENFYGFIVTIKYKPICSVLDYIYILSYAGIFFVLAYNFYPYVVTLIMNLIGKI